MNARRESELQEAVQRFSEAVASFEKMREGMRQRRVGASDSVMASIDERLVLTARTLATLKRGLALAEEELARERRSGNY